MFCNYIHYKIVTVQFHNYHHETLWMLQNNVAKSMNKFKPPWVEFWVE